MIMMEMLMNGCANDRDIGSNLAERYKFIYIIFLLYTFLLQFQRYLPNVTHVARNVYFSFGTLYSVILRKIFCTINIIIISIETFCVKSSQNYS